MANKIQIKRGAKANLPTLSVGELALCTDTDELYIGTNGGNKRTDVKAVARDVKGNAAQIQFSDGEDLITKYNDLLRKLEDLKSELREFKDGESAFFMVQG